MFPYRDVNPSSRTPIVTITLIAINGIVFLFEFGLGPSLENFLLTFGVVPKKWALLGQVEELTLQPILFSYLASLFLHGGWFHVISNMWYLWIFGDNVEDILGSFKFLAFYLVCGVAAGVIHTFFNLNSTLPAVGASGAIAGVLGAYLIRFPNARIHTLVPFFLSYEIIELPAVIVLGSWFLMQFLSGTAAIAATAQNTGGVAWWAHIGGFLAGIVLLPFFNPKRKTENRFPSF